MHHQGPLDVRAVCLSSSVACSRKYSGPARFFLRAHTSVCRYGLAEGVLVLADCLSPAGTDFDPDEPAAATAVDKDKLPADGIQSQVDPASLMVTCLLALFLCFARSCMKRKH